jgi:hypothetical protein
MTRSWRPLGRSLDAQRPIHGDELHGPEVIPSLKLTDHGLIDVEAFAIVDFCSFEMTLCDRSSPSFMAEPASRLAGH